MRGWFGFVVGLVVLTGGCGPLKTEDKTIAVSSGDARMNAAMATARSTAGTFITALQSPKSGQAGFSVKMPVTDGKNTEYMWLSDVSYDGKTFHGKINNQPETVKTVKLGQSTAVEPSGIADWMIIDNGVLVGGYTLRVLRDAMSASERADFDKSVPFVVK